MSFRKRVTVAALAAGLAIAVLAGCSDSVNTPTPATQQPALEATVQVTPTPKKEEEKSGTLSWQGNYRELSYTNGNISWKTAISEGIEETVLKATGLLRTPSNFRINGAITEEKYQMAIAWGEVQNVYFNKVSFRDLDSGAELDNYWSQGDSIKGMLITYDVPTENGSMDLLIIYGGTSEENISNIVERHHGRAVGDIPFIEVRTLTPGGSTPLTYNPLAFTEGRITNIEISDSGGITLEVDVTTYDSLGDRSEGITTVPFDRVLSLERYAPILGN